LVSPFHDHKGLMFRIVSYKDKHVLTDVEIIVNLGMLVTENGKSSYRFFRLDLERSRIESLIANWTIVHPIDDKSPLYGMNAEDYKNADVELYVLIRGFDEVFSSVVQKRTSYIFSEIKFHKKFASMARETENGNVLELHKLNDVVEAKAK